MDTVLFAQFGNDKKQAAKFVIRLVEGVNGVYSRNSIDVVRGKPVQFKLERMLVPTEELCASSSSAADAYPNAAAICNKERPDESATEDPILRGILGEEYPGLGDSAEAAVDPSDALLASFASGDYSSFCSSFLLSGRSFGATLGVSYLGGVCKDFSLTVDEALRLRLLSPNSGMISVDRRKSSVAEYTLAHELGHLLGASHDDDPECAAYDGTLGGVLPYGDHIMSSHAPEELMVRSREWFSRCSKSAFQATFSKMKSGILDWCLVKEDGEEDRGGQGWRREWDDSSDIIPQEKEGGKDPP